MDTEPILNLLRDARRPLTRRQLSRILKIDKDESDRTLRPVLQRLVAEGKVVRNRRAAYGIAEQMNLIRGRVSAHADGFGFVIPEAGGDDLFLSPREMRQVLHGDTVLAAVSGVDRRGRREGQIVEVIERAHSRVVGRFVRESGVAVVVPDDPRVTQDVLVPLEACGDARPGQIVVVEITEPPSPVRGPVGRVVTVLGKADEPGMATEIAIHTHQLPHDFPEAVIREAAAFGDQVAAEAVAGRKDYRMLPLVTIDGADARDFDDAVFAEARGKGFRLLVAIADVAAYVQPGSALDDEAQKRGTSVYFPDRVVPMLPETLSNGLCSLNPEVDRLCMVCEMRIDAQGKVTSSHFHEGVMRSQARLTYDQARRILFDGDKELRQKYRPVLDSLEALRKVYRLFEQRRQRRGAIEFESRAVQFRFDTEGRVADIVPFQRHETHKLIEECMIAANVEAARRIGQAGLPMLYRVHDSPPEKKLEDLKSFLGAHGLKVTWKDVPSPGDLARIQAQAADRPDAPLIDAVLLRSMALAVYQPENLGHFGLALQDYTHFTSPIRRYPDLLVHRAIKRIVRRAGRESYAYSRQAMDELGRRCSLLERRAEEAARDVDERLKIQFMQRHLGDLFDGLVTGVTGFGLFVELDGLGVSGLVHVTALPNDYYHFDPVGHALTGERRGLRFRLADRVKVEVLAANPDDRKVDFRLFTTR